MSLTFATSHGAEKAGISATGWYCVRSQSKHEHIAAAQLKMHPGIEVFVPRIRFKRSTSKGRVWVTEALFPNYLFARFDWRTSLLLVLRSGGVTGIVHFGPHWPSVPDETINGLRTAVGERELIEIPEILLAGDQVKIVGGTFSDFEAVISRVMPSQQRVAVLLDFLGRQTTVELGIEEVVKDADIRKLALK